MKIAWFTPWTEDSAIAGVSHLVAAALLEIAPGSAIDIWHPAGAGGRDAPFPAREIDLQTVDALSEYDAVVYNMGNHLGFHGAIYETSLARPGTVILHDVVLTDLFLPILLDLPEGELWRTLTDWYGPDGGRQTTEIRKDPEGWLRTDGIPARFPMLDPVLRGASQVITHSHHAADVLRDIYLGDVHVLGLPALHPPEDEPPAMGVDGLDERPVVLQGGAVNPNKRIPLILEAFRRYHLGEHLQLVIAGHISDAGLQQLEHDVTERGLGDSVRVMGPVDDQTMQRLLHRADIATVLRSPVTEASSAVLADSLAHGLATVSLDTGHYREYPADVLHLLPETASVADLGELLLRWARDPAEVARRGRSAAAYAERHLSARAYAESLVRVLPFGSGARRREALAAAAAGLVARNGFGPGSHLAHRVAEQAVLLFGNEPRRGRP